MTVEVAYDWTVRSADGTVTEVQTGQSLGATLIKPMPEPEERAPTYATQLTFMLYDKASRRGTRRICVYMVTSTEERN